MIEPEDSTEDHAKIDESLKVLLERVPIGIALSRGDNLLYVNRAYLQLLRNGRCSRQPNPSRLIELTPKWRSIVQANGQSSPPTLNKLSRHESTGLRDDGSEFQFQIELGYINFPDGIATLAFVTDITEPNKMKVEIPEPMPTQPELDSVFELSAKDQPRHRNAAGQEMLRSSDPAEVLAPATNGLPEIEGPSLARLVGGPPGSPESILPWLEHIAHDFNNLLTLIQVNASTLLAEKKLDKELADSAEQIYRAVDKAANLTSKLLAFGRGEQG